MSTEEKVEEEVRVRGGQGFNAYYDTCIRYIYIIGLVFTYMQLLQFWMFALQAGPLCSDYRDLTYTMTVARRMHIWLMTGNS